VTTGAGILDERLRQSDGRTCDEIDDRFACTADLGDDRLVREQTFGIDRRI
jgi:hypothetical protein